MGKFNGAHARTSQGRVTALIAALGALVMTSGLVVMAAAGTATADQDKGKGPEQSQVAQDKGTGKSDKAQDDAKDDKGQGGNGKSENHGPKVHKVFVCKYVGIPGVDERLQTGNNPISVDTHALEKKGFNGTFPFEFEDAHGKSVAIAWDERQGDGQNNEPAVTIDDCPAPEGPNEVRPQVSKSDPCGTANDTFSVTADPSKFTFTTSGTPAGGSVTIDFTPVAGFTIVGPDPLTLTFTNVPCPSGPTTVSPAVSFTEPTCEKPKGSAIVLGNQDKVDYTVTGTAGPGNSVTINAAPKAGFAFPPGTETSFMHTFKTIESLNCPTDEPTVGGTETTRPRPDKEPKPKPDEERPPAVLGTQAAVPSAVAAGLPGAPTDGGPGAAVLVGQLMAGAGLLLLLAAGWTGRGARRRGVHEA